MGAIGIPRAFRLCLSSQHGLPGWQWLWAGGLRAAVCSAFSPRGPSVPSPHRAVLLFCLPSLASGNQSALILFFWF